MKRTIKLIAWIFTLVGLAGVIAVTCIPEAKSVASLVLWRLRGETGPLYLPKRDGGMDIQHYVDGRRTGIWLIKDKTGTILAESEYRNDKPWNGICYVYPMKAWLGEYRNGKPWHGCLPQYSAATKSVDWLYFIEGKEVGYDEYCKEWNLSGPGHHFAGLGYLGQFQESAE